MTNQTRSHLIDELQRKGVFYDVQLQENYFHYSKQLDNGGQISEYRPTGKRTVVNTTLGKPIGVVSDKYVPVLNEDIFTQFDKVLLNCEGIDLTGAEVQVQTNHDGAKIMVEYILPAHKVRLNNGDEVALSITALNSFDGSTGFKVYCGGIRFKCMNGMVSGDMVSTYQKKHCAGLSIEAAAQVIETGLTSYMNSIDSWNAQMTAPITPETAWACLAEYANVKDFSEYTTYRDYNEKREKTNRDGSARKLAIDSYYEILKMYINELGKTEWALNNTLTHISTHGLRDEKPSIQSQISKADKARDMIRKYLNKSV